ncbi:MAG: DNA mismatch repair endonuclease MutL [Candidatus ainarchaeum sp.]|nr:DNA mismatch repair endonuclease MutL [Candidatus ainarchaeum sp.]MDD3975853.1 DNA mismatch repair endonuclease MutL [Candidatus ainarchaeum sp.]
MVIKKLNDNTINLISAGEVIESPADILKELIENSIDAFANKIIISIKNSGIDLIEIKDDGNGISKDDLKICLERHTTSKLLSIDDLFSLNSFGFRGEALASINAVSDLKIISSTNNSGEGYSFYNGVLESCPSLKGTTFIIKNLFENIPVRKKFLKSKSFEFSKLYDVFIAYSLMYPHISFNFSSEKKNINLQATSLENRMIQIFGNEIKLKTIPINIDNSLFKLKGFLSNPAKPIFLPNSYLFINNRFVFSSQIYKAITSAYKDYLMIQQKPFFILFIDIDSTTVDVNVHPKKRFVKLFNELLFLSELRKDLTKILDKHLGKSISNDVSNFNYFAKSDLSNNLNISTKLSYSNLKDFSTPNSFFTNLSSNNSQQSFYDYSSFKNIKLLDKEITSIVGQIHNTYIVCETQDGFLIIDQHAADERINLEENRLKFSESVDFQNLISPIYISLDESQAEVLYKNLDLIKKLGFNFEIIDNFSINLISIPIFLNKLFDKNYFINVLDDLKNNVMSFSKLKDNLIKLKSCKQSIKANCKLSISEQINLISKLSKVNNSVICAHGRPSVIFLSMKDMDKLFHRII